MNKQSVTALFQSPDAADLGITKQGSAIMIQNLNATTLPMCVGAPIHTLESDDVTIIMFALDDSVSMDVVRDILIETFNEIMIDGLRGASKKTANTIVIGGLKFSRNIEPLWGGGFIKLQDLPKLSINEYQANGSRTNLYQGMIDAVTAAGAYATQVFQETGTPPKVIVVSMTDGADNVRQATPDDVLTVTKGLSREIWKLGCAVFETWEPVDGKAIARDSGFEVFDFKKGKNADGSDETNDDVKRRFRHMMGTLSSQVISNSQHNVGAPNSKGFWQQ